MTALCLAGSYGIARGSVLYVADTGARAVYGYPLTHGLPNRSPATTLLLDYVPRQLAIAPDGSLYVERQSAKRVNVYARGASGHAAAIRSIETATAPLAIATDPQGYLYVALSSGTTEIYAPHARGRAKPVGHVGLGFSAFISSLALDSAGRLFIALPSPSGALVLEYANPRTAPSFVRALGLVIAPPEMAVDPTDELYEVDGFGRAFAFEPTACCLYPADRELLALNVSFHFNGIALEGRHAFLVSGDESSRPAIYTLDMLKGTQHPLSVVTGANLRSPAFDVVGQ